MRRIFRLILPVALLLVQQASGRQLDKRKWSRSEAVDYDPNSQTVRLDISLRLALGSPVVLFNSANNFKVEVLKLPGNCSQPDDRCFGPTLDAAVVQSRRLCLGDAGIPCDQKIPAGRKRASILLEHIYTGCYCFRLATYHDDSIRTARQLVDRPRFFYTDVIEYDVFKWNLSLDLSATSEQDMSLFMRVDEFGGEFRSFHVELFRHDDRQGLIDCHESDDEDMNEHLDVTFDGPVHWIMFHNRSNGYYCAVVIPDDDRCYPPLIDPEKTCARHSNIVQLRGTPAVVWEYNSGTAVTAYWIAGLLGIALVVLAVTLCVFLKRKMDPITVDFPLVRPDGIVVTELPSVLMFYSRFNNDGLVENIGNLKRAIRDHVTHRIYDDDDNDSTIDVEGIEWFSKRFQEPNIRIVIVLCPEMIRCQERIVKGSDDDNEDDSRIDRVCCYRLKELLYHFVPTGNNYRQIFAVHFDDLDEGNRIGQISCLLTPYRSYRWPSGRNALLTELRQGYSNRRVYI